MKSFVTVMESDRFAPRCAPLVSVVVPVFNAEEYLREALESLRRQTYRGIEVVLVNDGSTDGSVSICREFCRLDSRFRLLTQPNRGVSASRNLGIEKANGDWIVFMDADDIMARNCISALLSAQSLSGAKIVVGDYTRNIKNLDIPGEEGKYAVAPTEKVLTMGLYQHIIVNNPWGVLFHESVLNADGPVRFRDCRYEDLDFFYRAFDKVPTICLVDSPVYYYRDNPGSFINTWSDARLDVLDVTDRMVDYFKDRGPGLLKAARDRRFSAHCNMLLEMFRFKEIRPSQMMRCCDVIKRNRLAELTDRNVRLKNKLGALFSYLLLPAVKLISRNHESPDSQR